MVEAYQDIWLVGDTFLKDIIRSLQSMKASANRTSGKETLFIYQEFNVKHYYSNSAAYKAVARIVNAVIDGINE